MSMNNAVVADFLRRLATAVSLEGESRFKSKAYRRAAETIESLDENVVELVQTKADLTALPGVGDAIAAKIQEIVMTGRLQTLEKKLGRMSPQVAELSNKPRLDAKVVLRVYKKLRIGSLEELHNRLESDEIRNVLGPRVDFHVRRGLDDRPRALLYEVQDLATAIEAYLSKSSVIERAARTGSFRREQETVGDLNFLVSGPSAAAAFAHFSKFGAVRSSEKLSRTEQRFSLSSGITATLRWTPAERWGLDLILSTGAPAHISQLRARAKQKKISLTPLAFKRSKRSAADESAVYRALGLPLITPELREGRGEIEAAEQGELPDLLQREHLRGDLHMHTTASDGRNTLEEMAAAATERGYKYIAITDHSQSLKITNGLTEKRLFAHIKAIDKLNARLKGLVILKSAEVDILEEGALDYTHAALKELDLTICSIHSRFALNKEQQTERIMRAMDNPYFNILGHATGRLLLKREGYELDIERIIGHAKACGCTFEINSSPDRLDLSDEHAKLAKEHGLKIAVNTDAHSVAELDFIEAGIKQARRAWLEPGNVLNCLPLAKLRKALAR